MQAGSSGADSGVFWVDSELPEIAVARSGRGITTFQFKIDPAEVPLITKARCRTQPDAKVCKICQMPVHEMNMKIAFAKKSRNIGKNFLRFFTAPCRENGSHVCR